MTSGCQSPRFDRRFTGSVSRWSTPVGVSLRRGSLRSAWGEVRAPQTQRQQQRQGFQVNELAAVGHPGELGEGNLVDHDALAFMREAAAERHAIACSIWREIEVHALCRDRRHHEAKDDGFEFPESDSYFL